MSTYYAVLVLNDEKWKKELNITVWYRVHTKSGADTKRGAINPSGRSYNVLTDKEKSWAATYRMNESSLAKHGTKIIS